MIDADLEKKIARNLDRLADQAPAPAVGAVADARRAGDSARRRAVVVGVGAAVMVIAVTVTAAPRWIDTRPSGQVAGAEEAGTPSGTSGASTGAGLRAGAGWEALRAPQAGTWEVERYATPAELFRASPLIVRATVANVALAPAGNREPSEPAYSDLLLTLDVSDSSGASPIGDVVVQLGPFFNDEADVWVARMSSGSEAIIGNETLWALRERQGDTTYRPLTSDSVFVRDGEATISPLAERTPISIEVSALTWSELLHKAGLHG